MALEQILRCSGLGKTPGSQWARSSPKSWSPSPSLAWKLSLRACTRVQCTPSSVPPCQPLQKALAAGRAPAARPEPQLLPDPCARSRITPLAPIFPRQQRGTLETNRGIKS